MPEPYNNGNGATPDGTLSNSPSTSTISSLTLDTQANNRVQGTANKVKTTPTGQTEISKVTKGPIVTADPQEVKHTVITAGKKVAELTSSITKSAIPKTPSNASAFTGHVSPIHPRPSSANEEHDEKTRSLRDLYIKQYGDIFDVRPYEELDEDLYVGGIYGDLMKCEGQAWYSSFWEDPREREGRKRY
jgi:hypothetical protein